MLRAALVVALAACAVLFVDYQQTSSALCGAAGGCAKVRASSYSHLLGVSLPTWGLGALAGLSTMAIWASRPRHWRLLAGGCALAALAALGLIGLQLFVIGAVCRWCMVVDVSLVVAAAAALAGLRAGPDPEPLRLRLGWGLVATVAVAAPLLVRGPPGAGRVPAEISRLQAPHIVDVITFTDFECPYCRQLHPLLRELADANPRRLRVVSLMVPLAFHPHARAAALAYLCAAEAKRPELAHRLYTAPRADLDAPGLRAILADLGLDTAAFEACTADGRTAKRLAEHERLFHQAGLRGLPATFVESRLVQGADEQALRQAVEAELGGGGGLRGLLLTAASALLLLVAGAGLWQARAGRAQNGEAKSADG